MTDPTAPALLFMGDLVVVARQPGLIAGAHERGLAPLLVVTPHTDPARLAACRADPDHPLSALAEVLVVPDARVETVLAAVQPLLRRYDIRGVLSCGEVFVEPVGVLADCLGLPGGGPAARICRNKLLQRTAAPDLAPRWQAVRPAERAAFVPDFPFPVVVKPVDRFYSLGVRQVHDPAELTEVLATYPAEETVLVESRVVGSEFSVEAFVQGGEVLWSGVTGKESNEAGGVYFTEMAHLCPAELPAADAQALVAANAHAVERFGVRDAITHAEFRLSADGPVLMELAARMPGDAITFLWQLATGQSMEPVMLDLALGVPASYPPPLRRAGQLFLEHPHGVLDDVVSAGAPVYWTERDGRWPVVEPVAGDEAGRALAVLVGRLPGDVLGPQTDSSQRSVSVLFDAPFGDTAEKIARAAADDIAISVVADRPDPVSHKEAAR